MEYYSTPEVAFWLGTHDAARMVPASQSCGGRAARNYEIMPMGIQWPELDEDLGIAGMPTGRT